MDEAENRATILVVDDDDTVRGLLVEHLSGLGYEVLDAPSGETAVAAMDRDRVDLVISDIRMPTMSGIDLCARIKTDARFELLPVILLPGGSDFELRVAGLAAGADDLFVKPVNPIELGTRVAALLRVKALLDANRELYRTVQAQAAALTEHQRTPEQRVQEQAGEDSLAERDRCWLGHDVSHGREAGSNGSRDLMEPAPQRHHVDRFWNGRMNPIGQKHVNPRSARIDPDRRARETIVTERLRRQSRTRGVC